MTIQERMSAHERVIAESHAQVNEAALLLGAVVVSALLLMAVWGWCEHRSRHEAARRALERAAERDEWLEAMDWPISRTPTRRRVFDQDQDQVSAPARATPFVGVTGSGRAAADIADRPPSPGGGQRPCPLPSPRPTLTHAHIPHSSRAARRA